jgi:hypothetical protein
MADGAPGPITQLLNAANNGDDDAAAQLLPLIYGELHRIAQARMAMLRPGATLQPTAPIHEAYPRLLGDDKPSWNSRAHFFGAAIEREWRFTRTLLHMQLADDEAGTSGELTNGR